MKYLVYSLDTDEIGVRADKPAGYTGMFNPILVQGLIPVWHATPVNPEIVLRAIHVLLVRIRSIPFAEVDSAIAQIVSTFKPNVYSIAALGASPKFIKWILKSKGYNTVALGVSKVKGDVAPTREFIEYLERKLAKVTNANIAVIDYAKSGESLVKIKTILASLWTRGSVVAIALGVGAEFKDSKFKPGVDFVVKNIPTLEKGFEGTKYKDMLGRSKNMVDYTTFPAPVKGGHVNTLQQKNFASAKTGFARAAELGPLHVLLNEDFMDLGDTQTRDPDSDGDAPSFGFED